MSTLNILVNHFSLKVANETIFPSHKSRIGDMQDDISGTTLNMFSVVETAFFAESWMMRRSTAKCLFFISPNLDPLPVRHAQIDEVPQKVEAHGQKRPIVPLHRHIRDLWEWQQPKHLMLR